MMENQLPNGERLIEEPTYPEDWECCDNGCEELCVYEIYRVQKQAYDEPQQRLKSVPKLLSGTDKLSDTDKPAQ